MLHDLMALVLNGVQMIGICVLLLGALLLVGGVFSGRIGTFVRAGCLILIGGYIAGFGGSFHP